MATEQDKIIVYVPKAEGVKFRAICEAQDKTMTAVLRRFVREYIANGASPEHPVKGTTL